MCPNYSWTIFCDKPRTLHVCMQRVVLCAVYVDESKTADGQQGTEVTGDDLRKLEQGQKNQQILY